jgi:hypothetical protein
LGLVPLLSKPATLCETVPHRHRRRSPTKTLTSPVVRPMATISAIMATALASSWSQNHAFFGRHRKRKNLSANPIFHRPDDTLFGSFGSVVKLYEAVQPSFRNNDGVDVPLDSAAEAGAMARSSTASSCHLFRGSLSSTAALLFFRPRHLASGTLLRTQVKIGHCF